MTPEQIIQKQVMEYLKLKRIWFRRFNTGRRGGVQYGSVGMGDILCTFPKHFVCANYDTSHDICLLWLEIKTPKGQQSLDQIKFMDEVREEGHYYAVIRSIEDLEAVLKEIQ